MIPIGFNLHRITGLKGKNVAGLEKMKTAVRSFAKKKRLNQNASLSAESAVRTIKTTLSMQTI